MKNKKLKYKDYSTALYWFLSNIDIESDEDKIKYMIYNNQLKLLIEKQRPHKMIYDDFDYYCPCCKNKIDVFHLFDNYCSQCGQKFKI